MENVEEVTSRARRAIALLTGASALLQRRDSGVNDGGEALRELLIEAHAELSGVADSLEGALAREHEKLRAERLHKEAAAAIAAGGVR
jgi:hypothetical protein